MICCAGPFINLETDFAVLIDFIDWRRIVRVTVAGNAAALEPPGLENSVEGWGLPVGESLNQKQVLAVI